MMLFEPHSAERPFISELAASPFSFFPRSSDQRVVEFYVFQPSDVSSSPTISNFGVYCANLLILKGRFCSDDEL